MCSQEEILERIKESPGISGKELRDEFNLWGKQLSKKVGSLRRYGLIRREPSKKVKMSFDYYPVI